MKILVQFESGPNTRWLFRADEVRKQLEGMGRSVARAMSDGSLPRVTAIVEEQQTDELVKVCAWCKPGVTAPNITHGICQYHKQAMLAELAARKTAQQPEVKV